MKNIMNRDKRQKGMSLSELFVVLAVTVVLAIILMPAIASNDNPDRAEDILNVAAVPVVFSDDTRAFPNVDQTKRAQRREAAPADLSVTPAEIVDEVEAQQDERSRAGALELLTTDVLRRHGR